MNSFIRWAGSKRLILGKLRMNIPVGFKRYVEPFAGSACLFFDLNPSVAVLGDLNSELISTFEQVKKYSEKVVVILKNIGRGKKHYLRIRSLDPNKMTESRRAARFIYLNHYCFNGLYRVNQAGRFNVPYFPNKTSLAFRESLVLKAAKVLKNAIFVNDDFEYTLSMARKGDFAYIDPPYVMKEREVFSEYTKNSFSTKDLARLSNSLGRLNQKGVRFLVSYADCREARQLLKKWNPRRIWTRRNISGFKGARRGNFELLGSNYLRVSNGKN